MCGVAGRVSRGEPVERELILSFSRSLGHRGPDDEGTWFSEDGRVGLGHRRLSILDLSSLGRQPMVSPDGRFVIVYNGEIYNFRELRRELEGAGENFSSNTDTEVLLRLWSMHGPKCLLQLRGMYAFAIWDNLERCLWLVRDPLGIKPLYYTQDGDTLTFASEVKALRSAGVAGEISARGIGAFLRWGSIPAPLSVYEGVHALPAASVLCWRQVDGRTEIETYWDYQTAWSRSQSLIADVRSWREAIEWVRQALLESVRAHLVSDVPVGSFLSGGIDSTAVVSLMRQAGQQEIETFSIGCDDKALDESSYAVRAAQRYDTRHHEWRVTQADFARLRTAFLAAMDQPTIDGFNIFVVAMLAHQHGIKVVTSGIGGDELFRGYPLQFQRLPALWTALRRTPSVLRRSVAGLLAVPLVKETLGHRSSRMADLLHARPELEQLYLWTRELFRPEEIRRLLTDAAFADEATRVNMTDFLPVSSPGQANLRARISMLETSRYLGSQLLVDSDNFSMAHSLELRVPLVDRTLFEQIVALRDFFFGGRAPKALLVAATRDLPNELVYRPKQGFTFPFATWLSKYDWHPKSSVFDETMCDRISQGLASGRLHWSTRWALEVLDNLLVIHGL